ncbi:FG-GAP-like repeat-containing protein [Stratiformator vulcanicus]|uniref:FG-GAP-like repeat-containing protein n=1 Tax=Stratiformator vulcanicus TaxID=2527980 RepID=UPI0028774CA4|nr:FG-GAP-like repeat-containing protein [Stratiformator vulcanicus]
MKALEKPVRAMCGACHAYPDASLFHRDKWEFEVAIGYEFFDESSDPDIKKLIAPPFADTVGYYVVKSGGWHDIENATPIDSAAAQHFLPEVVPYPSPGPIVGSVSDVNWYPPSGKQSGYFTVCDMWHGRILRVDVKDRKFHSEIIHLAKHPARLRPIGAEGSEEYLVAELGSFLPANRADAKLYKLSRIGSDSTLTRTNIWATHNRVADAAVGDLNADGNVEIAVAEFGWRTEGRVTLLTCDSVGEQWKNTTIDDRYGASDVRLHDLDDDGRLDLIVLISQEHEVIECYRNLGHLTFQRHQLFSADNPAFGLSGLVVTDFDVDGDLDIVFTNGDMLDSGVPSVHHGVRWLRNDGEFQFSTQLIGKLPGAYRAVVGDLDGDGDLDVAASAYIPLGMKNFVSEAPTLFDLLVWFERQADGTFTRHSVYQSHDLGSADIELGDFDLDGDLDIATGQTLFEPKEPSALPERVLNRGMLTVWWNQLKSAEMNTN